MIKNNSIGLGIDLGTTNLIVYLEKKGIIFNEPSVISFDRESNTTVAAGKDAHQMLGKVHSKINVIKPLRNGVLLALSVALLKLLKLNVM
jgi:rod shape-determining protein MreB